MRKSAVAAAFILAAGSLFAEYAPEKWNLEAREKFAAQRLRDHHPEGLQGLPDGQIDSCPGRCGVPPRHEEGRSKMLHLLGLAARRCGVSPRQTMDEKAVKLWTEKQK